MLMGIGGAIMRSVHSYAAAIVRELTQGSSWTSRRTPSVSPMPVNRIDATDRQL